MVWGAFMNILYFLIGVGTLLIGHYIKTLRWEMFIRIYEKPSRSILLRSMSFGYLLNFIFPLRIGDVVRFFYVGKKLKNGLGFAASTVIVDRYLDILTVAMLFFAMKGIGLKFPGLEESAQFYFVIAIVLMALLVLAILFRDLLKKMTKKLCSIFNEHIKFECLQLFWNLICAFKDLLKVNWKKLIGNTILMWMSYMCSYYFIAKCLSFYDNKIELIDIFSSFFSKSSLDVANISSTVTISNLSNVASLVMWLYMLVPLCIMLILSYLPVKMKYYISSQLLKNEYNPNEEINMLPQISERERLKFLERYFGNEEKEYLSKFIELNRNISIIQDYSAGSNATTMLCIDRERSFYRKYAFGQDGDKLQEQVNWIKKNENIIPLPQILKEEHGQGYCCYDMEYNSDAIGMFHFVHSNPLEIGKEMLENILERLKISLYDTSKRAVNPALLERYINSKVHANLEKIFVSGELKTILEYEEIVINGISYKNLKYFSPNLSTTHLLKVFAEDICCDIHGDLTLENIICKRERKGLDFYFIDPNPTDVHSTLFMDYGKLLQSLHGGYEFLLLIQNITIEKNQISYIETKSQTYQYLFQYLKEYIESAYTKEQVISIFYHEIVHWLRLMPYKLKKGNKEAIVFYTGLVKVLNYVEKEYGEIT